MFKAHRILFLTVFFTERLYILKTKTNVKQFPSDNTDTNPKRQKGDEEKPAENTINSDSLKSNVEEENEEESTRKLPEHFRKGGNKTEWISHQKCAHKKFQCRGNLDVVAFLSLNLSFLIFPFESFLGH